MFTRFWFYDTQLKIALTHLTNNPFTENLYNKLSYYYNAKIYFLRPVQTRKHCCGNTVVSLNVSPFARTGNICCGNIFCFRETKNVSDFFQKHFVFQQMFPRLRGEETMFPQQCFRSNVSSFAGAFRNCRQFFATDKRDQDLF